MRGFEWGVRIMGKSRVITYTGMFIIMLLTLYVVLQMFFASSKPDNISVETNLVSCNTDGLVLDIAVTNKSDRDLYNLEILSYCEDTDWTNSAVSKDKVEADDSLHLRAEHEPLSESVTDKAGSGYGVNKFNKLIVFILIMAYLLVLGLIMYGAVTEHTGLNAIVLFMTVFVSYIFLSWIHQYKRAYKDSNIIHTYEDVLKFDVDGESGLEVEPVRVHILVNYTLSSIETVIDKNNNGIPTVAEKEDLVTDTDGDGVPDYYELYFCNTNPLLLDTEVEGLGDCNKDSDSDGLSNLAEVKLGSNPINTDTDYDGLEDKDELSLGTDILNWDTDGDNMSDGFEIEQGYDPLTANNKVVITKELLSEGKHSEDTIKTRVEVNTDASNAESLVIYEYSTLLLNEETPGYIGSAFEFNINGDIESVKLSFELDESWFKRKEYDPCIYYFNEDTQLLEELETEIDGNVLSTTVSHFSVYVVLNRIEVNDVFMGELADDFKNVNEEIREFKETIGDGLTNYEKSLIESGVLKTGTGVSLFDGVDFSLWRDNPDADGDGLLNGEEVSVEIVNGHVYIRLKSDPFKKDTDGDGVEDCDDFSPFVLGPTGRLIGTMYIAVDPIAVSELTLFTGSSIALENSKDFKIIRTGHAWLVFNNWCDMVLDNPKFRSGHYKVKFDGDSRIITHRNLYPYKIKANSYTSFGYFEYGLHNQYENKNKTGWPDDITADEIGQIIKQQVALEKPVPGFTEEMYNANYQQSISLGDTIYDSFRINQEFKNVSMDTGVYPRAVAICATVTDWQWNCFVDVIENMPDYGFLKYNCTNLAVECWNSMYGDDPANRILYDPLVFGIPSKLHTELKKYHNAELGFHWRMRDVFLRYMQPRYEFDADGNLIED